MTGALHSILAKFPWVNNSKHGEFWFITWLNKSLHMQVSHLRVLKMYPDRYEYSVNRLSFDKLRLLHSLLDMVTAVSPNKKHKSYDDLLEAASPSTSALQVSPPAWEMTEILKTFGDKTISVGRASQPACEK